MADTYKLKHPNGFDVEVKTAARRDALVARGYKESGSSSGSKKTTAPKMSKEGSKKQGGK